MVDLAVGAVAAVVLPQVLKAVTARMKSTGASARPGWKAFTAGTKLSSAMNTKQ